MKISVIIPFYNLAPYVRPCLDSVVAAINEMERGGGAGRRTASYSVEVICVDDGSTDATPEHLETYALNINQSSVFNLRILKKPNGGEGSARNAGLEAATGDWVTYIDGDDLWLPNMLVDAVPLLAAHQDADVVNLRFVSFKDGEHVPRPRSVCTVECFDTTVSIESKVLLDIGVYPTFIRRESLHRLRFSVLPLGADRLYVAQCLALAKKVVMSDAVVHAYRVREGSMARATWTARKTNSQCDYATGALAALAGSGKSIGREGINYLASLWLSDVPAHVRRLRDREDRRLGAVHWTESFDSAGGVLLRGHRRIAYRLLRLFARHPFVACEAAHILRVLGII